MTGTIPASAFVSVQPGVIGAGGSGVALNGLFLTTNSRVPVGEVLSFTSAADVATYFGATSLEAAEAAVYFAGFTNRTAMPAAMLFAQYPTTSVAAYLRGGNAAAAYTLAQLNAIAADKLTIVSDGVAETSGTITLSGATSFSNAATIIQSAFTTPTFSVSFDSVSGGFVFTTTATGTSATMAYATSTTASATACTTSGTVLTVGGTVTGTFNVGDTVTGTDLTNSLPANTTILNQLTGTTGGAGTYTISAAATPGNLSSCAVTATGPSGAFVKALLLTQATGAVTSQGAIAGVPATNMGAIVAQSTNWATFTTIFDPDNGIGNTQKQAFAAWKNGQNNRYMYVPMDSDITPTESTDAATSLGRILKGNGDSGTALVYEPTELYHAAFIMGAVASIDFTHTNGNTSLGYKNQAGLTPAVSNQTVMANLLANGYNSYVSAATANNLWDFLYNGQVTGEFLTIQRYVNQIWMNSNFQVALMNLLTSANAVPYVAAGYALIEAALQDPINAGINFGAVQPGVQLSAEQIALVNYQAGANIGSVLQTRGWYLQVKDPGAVVRGLNGSPSISFWYTDGGSVLQINMSSTDVI